jgi:hypothetical protein
MTGVIVAAVAVLGVAVAVIVGAAFGRQSFLAQERREAFEAEYGG